MHELSLAASMLETIGERLGGKRALTKVHLTVGMLSGVAPEALEFCFPMLAEEEGFGKPVMVIAREKARAECGACGKKYGMESAYTLCPGCGSLERKILSGKRFTLDAVEVEDV